MAEYPNSRFPAQNFPQLSSSPSNASPFWKKVLEAPLPPVIRQVDISIVIWEISFPTDVGVGKFPDLLKWVFTNSLSGLQRELSCLRQPKLSFLLTVWVVFLISFLTRKKTAQVQRNHRPSTVTNFQTSKSTWVLNYATHTEKEFSWKFAVNFCFCIQLHSRISWTISKITAIKSN